MSDEPLVPGGTIIPIPLAVIKRGKRGKPEVVEERIANFTLLPGPKDKCPECATAHPPEYPHNQQSLFYQYHFYGQHGRWPTWADAMAHCDEDMKAFWKKALAEKGINVEEDKPDAGTR
jgi:hypothetical protein